MALSQVKARELLEKISETHGIPLEKLYKTAYGYVKKPSRFASKKAQEKFEEEDLSFKNVRGTGKEGKITIDDVRRACGEETVEKKVSLFASKVARELAIENGFEESDFKINERSGRVLKSCGKKSITIKDVRTKAGIPEPEKQ